MAFLPSLSLNARVVIVVPPCLTNLLVLQKEEDESQVNCLLVFLFVYSLSFHQNLPQSALRRRHLLSAAAAAAAAAMESVVETVSSSAAWVLGVTLAIANASFAWISSWIPVLLVFDMVATSWLVCHTLVIHHLIPAARDVPLWTLRPPSELVTAYALLGIYVFVLFHTAGCLVSLWWYSFGIIRRGYRIPKGAVTCRKMVMQTLADADDSRYWFDLGFRPNLCLRCSRNADLEGGEGPGSILDRMYHGTTNKGVDLGCIALFDHYCWWLWCPVSLETQKPYLLFMGWVVVFHLYSLGILCFSLSSFGTRWSLSPVVVAAGALPFVFLWVKKAPFRGQWVNQGLRNQTHKETTAYIRNLPQQAWPMGIAGPNGLEHVTVGFNPWDLGAMGNLRAVLGDSIWEWPFFWRTPRRVREFGGLGWPGVGDLRSVTRLVAPWHTVGGRLRAPP
ncbi:DHHC zinc finger domain-containing protein [Colletotrichum paranaense]|uniref:DHHC zinc finger domain-containing protein n=1 Tax=Colletotrichum paranaense TaxID=1914294 RepID=A0ABQ9SWR5_9PEZI|nr:DHHC zinc finger domain-containing protein [Colletotrichum paranaense]KAK1543957.1 DHHC zinc finger domain-containing protein [Colletotrichum paranaense]